MQGGRGGPFSRRFSEVDIAVAGGGRDAGLDDDAVAIAGGGHIAGAQIAGRRRGAALPRSRSRSPSGSPRASVAPADLPVSNRLRLPSGRNGGPVTRTDGTAVAGADERRAEPLDMKSIGDPGCGPMGFDGIEHVGGGPHAHVWRSAPSRRGQAGPDRGGRRCGNGSRSGVGVRWASIRSSPPKITSSAPGALCTTTMSVDSDGARLQHPHDGRDPAAGGEEQHLARGRGDRGSASSWR